MIETKLDKGLRLCNLRVIVVLLMQSPTHECVYRVYTSDGQFTDYVGFNAVPPVVKDWMKERNSLNYVISSAMVISGVEVV